MKLKTSTAFPWQSVTFDTGVPQDNEGKYMEIFCHYHELYPWHCTLIFCITSEGAHLPQTPPVPTAFGYHLLFFQILRPATCHLRAPVKTNSGAPNWPGRRVRATFFNLVQGAKINDSLGPPGVRPPGYAPELSLSHFENCHCVFHVE